MSDPPPKKVGSLRDRIAAFENKGGATAPAPPAPRPKPAGGVSWKPRPRSPPPVSNEETPAATKPGGMSAADAKASIGQGGSLKERMAALQGLHAFGGASAPPPPKPATEKPKWKPPPVVSPPPADDDETDEPHQSTAAPETEPDAHEHKQTEEGGQAEKQDEGEAEPDPEEEERQRRAAIAARMARLGGARVGMAPPVFGRKPDIKKHETHKTEGEEHNEEKSDKLVEPTTAVSPPTEHPVTSPPETASITSQKSDATPTDYFESKDAANLSPESAPSPPVRSPAMPVPAAPRRAAPPRKRPPKSPSPAPATVLHEGTVNESPSPLPDVPPAAPEVSAPSAVQASSIGPHGDREPEVTGSQVEAMLENVHVSETHVAEETEELLRAASPAVAISPTEEQPKEVAPIVLEEGAHGSAGPADDITTDAETQEDVVEPVAVARDHHGEQEEYRPEVDEPTHVEQEEAQEETEEEEAARRKRIAERLAKAGGVNPLGGSLYAVPHPPVSPPPSHEAPVSVERRQSLRKDSHGSVASEHPSSPPPVPTSPRPEAPRRQGSVHSIQSQASVEHPSRRASQDERRHSVEVHEPTSAPVRTITEEIVEEPEPHDYHEAVPAGQELAEESYLQEEAGDEHVPVQYDEPTPIEEEYDVQVEEEEVPPPPPRTHPSVPEASPPSRRSSKRLSSIPPPRLPPPPPPEAEEVGADQSPSHEPVKRLSVPPVAPPRPPPPPPAADIPDEEQEHMQEQERYELPPPVHRELRTPVQPPSEQAESDRGHRAPEVTLVAADHREQPVIYSGASREDYEDNTYTDETYEEPDYEGHEQDLAEDDDPIEALVRHSAHQHDPVHASREEQTEGQDVYDEVAEQEEAAPPPPPRRPPVPDVPPIRRPSMEQHARLTSPPPVPKTAPMIVTVPAKNEIEVFADSDGDPIDPGFYSPPKSPRTQPLPVPISPPPIEEQAPQEQPEPEAVGEEEEDPEQARRRTIAERMAKLGGIRFGAPPPPPPVRRPQPPEDPQDNEESAGHEPEGETEEAPEEEEDEYARKQRIAARIAGMGGMRFGMLPGAPPPAPRPQVGPTNPPSHAEDHSTSPTVPRRVPPAVPPPPPPAESSEDDGERIEAEMSEAEEVTYEEAQEPEEEAPPPIPSREGRHASHSEARRPPVPQTSRPPVPQVPAPTHPKRMSTGHGAEGSGTSDFSYPPPPPARRPSIPTHDTQNDFVMVGTDNETVEEPPPPPPRTVSLKKTHHHPPARTTPLPPPLSAEPAADPGIPHVDFGGETDLSLSGQWTEDPINIPPPPPTKGEFVQPSTTRPDVQLSAEELMKQWGRVGVQIHETASVLFDKSKKALVGDGSYLGFVTAVLSQVPNASHPAPPFDNLGYLIYMQTSGSVQRRVTDVMPGDLVVIQEAKFKGHKGLQSYHQTAGVGEPLYAIVSDYEQKKSKVRVFQANQHVGQQTVESVSYRLEDLKSGSVKIFRVLEA